MGIPDFIKEILFDEEAIAKRIPEIREQIFDHYKNVKGRVKVLSVLKGGRYFSKLLFKNCPRKFQLGYISASSYVNNKKLPNNKIYIDVMGQKLYRSNVLLIDDIYDTGNTLSQINTRLGTHSAVVQNVVLVKRTGHHKFNVPILSYGFEVKQKDFLVGCGLDYNGQYRKLPYIASVKEE
jgi:hypoxanthine phosphoribosyltransferase